jgi:putative ABC transport system permease protein
MAMLKNYFKTAFRNLWKNKSFSALNILGLAIGMGCSLLIMLWVRDERSMDAFHAKGARLFDVYYRQYFDKKIDAGPYTTGSLPDELKRLVPEVELASGFLSKQLYTFQVGEKILKENGACAGADFFKMFSYPLLLGDPGTALNSPVSISVSRKMATDLFGSPRAALGKILKVDNKRNLMVSAVFEDLPKTSSDQFDFIINWKSFLDENAWAKEWGNYGPSTFILLQASANPRDVEKKITCFMDKYIGRSDSYRIELGMQRFGEMYLHSEYKDGKIAGGRIGYVNLFSLIAIFILVIACINFMNLTTARSVKRAREIGIRKVVGAIRPALFRQFIGEALLLTSIAVCLALVLVMLMLPLFNHLTSKQIEFPFFNFSLWMGLAGLTLMTGFIAGSYPALFLSSFNPIRVLRGSMKFSAGAIGFRKGLVVFQFVLSITLIIATLIVSRQINFIQSRNLGFDRENLLYIALDGDLPEKYTVFKQEAARLPGVTEITRMSSTPTDLQANTFWVDWEGKAPNAAIKFSVASVGYDFVKTLKLQLLQGRDFSKIFATDSVAYILNESALKQVGYKEPIGKPFTFWGKKGSIVGILKDFHFNSLHEKIQPLILRLNENEDYGNSLLRIKAGQTKEAMEGLESICRQLNPKFPFTYYFADQEFQKLYKSEQVVGKLSSYFAFLSIFICCLGLLGLAMFTAEQRTREIGIRKLLGASVGSLFKVLSLEFLVLVLIALLIATPIAWFATNKWLQDYAYHTSLSWGLFLTAGALAFLIALATISFQMIRASLASPVKSLKAE